ncbi:unnamed protein product, partial [Staurois parvus]
LLSCWGLCLCICGLCAYFGRLLRWPFFGALRIGELVSPSNSVLGGLLVAEVRCSGEWVEVLVRRSKTNQLGRGGRVRLFFVLPASLVCPVRAVQEFLSRRPVGQGCFFRHAERELVRDVKLDFLQLRRAYPGMVVVWSDIVARTSWRWARSVERFNKAQIMVNREVGRFFSHHGGLVVRHLELEADTWRYLRCDGVHFDCGWDGFMVPGSAGWHTAGCSFVAWHAWV